MAMLPKGSVTRKTRTAMPKMSMQCSSKVGTVYPPAARRPNAEAFADGTGTNGVALRSEGDIVKGIPEEDRHAPRAALVQAGSAPRRPPGRTGRHGRRPPAAAVRVRPRPAAA